LNFHYFKKKSPKRNTNLQKCATKDKTKNIFNQKGGEPAAGVFSNKISNLKLIVSQGNIEGFKQFCNSITLL
jgi:hypothetical protein